MDAALEYMCTSNLRIGWVLKYWNNKCYVWTLYFKMELYVVTSQTYNHVHEWHFIQNWNNISNLSMSLCVVCFSMNCHHQKVQKRTALPTLCCKKIQEFAIKVLVLWNFKVSCRYWQSVFLKGTLKQKHRK